MVTRLIAGLLYEVRPADPLTFAFNSSNVAAQYVPGTFTGMAALATSWKIGIGGPAQSEQPAARARGHLQVLSTMTTTGIEEVIAARGNRIVVEGSEEDVAREVAFESTSTPEQVRATIAEALSSGAQLIELEDEKGIYQTSNLNRYNFRANLRASLTPTLTTTATAGFLSSDLRLPDVAWIALISCVLALVSSVEADTCSDEAEDFIRASGTASKATARKLRQYQASWK